MSDVEFKPWPKIGRDNPFLCTITEKIDGSNGCVIIQDGQVVGVQSRKRLITPEDDNFGFATWVEEHKEELTLLGDGYHYGEWAGPGIQKNPHCLSEKSFFLFNTFRWGEGRQSKPECCDVVPVLFEGELQPHTIQDCLESLKLRYEHLVPEGSPEGIICYLHGPRSYSKHTYRKGHKGNE